MIDRFNANRTLTSPGFRESLPGIVSNLWVRLDDSKKVLFPDGSPALPAEFKDRFPASLEQILQGRAAAKVRLVLA